MGDVGKDWKFWNEQSKKHRTEEQERSNEILKDWCRENSVEMKKIQEWHIRLTKDWVKLDIFPERQKYHYIPLNTRGVYRDLIPFVEKIFSILKP